MFVISGVWGYYSHVLGYYSYVFGYYSYVLGHYSYVLGYSYYVLGYYYSPLRQKIAIALFALHGFLEELERDCALRAAGDPK